MSYTKATIWFMTGTGNSYRAATWLRDAAAAQGAKAEMQRITTGWPPKDEPKGADRLLGLVFPTHGFTAPWAVLRFVRRLPRGEGTHAAVVATRAGAKVGPLFTPGLEGTACWLVALLLWVKGYVVRGVMGLDMPSNFVLVHPPLPAKACEAIIERARTKTAAFVEVVLSGSRRFRGVVGLLVGLVLLPVSVAYLLLGRFFIAKLMFANSKCTGCGQCAQRCPFGAIRMYGKTRRRPYWTFQCENCLQCMAWCPERAIESGHSFGVLLYFATSVPVGVWAMNWLTTHLHWPAAADNIVTRLLLQYPYALLAIFVSYLVFTCLLHIPLVNRLFTWTTLTHYYGRYREPDTELTHLDGEAEPCASPPPSSES